MVIQDPRKCKFDPRVLECKGADAADCLTAEQVAAARKMYEPARNVRTGKVVSPAFTAGNEAGWGTLIGGQQPISLGMDQFNYVVFKDPKRDWRTFDFDKDIDRTIEADNGLTDARNPDIKPFLAHDGNSCSITGGRTSRHRPRPPSATTKMSPKRWAACRRSTTGPHVPGSGHGPAWRRRRAEHFRCAYGARAVG